jgi:hypothetical protein
MSRKSEVAGIAAGSRNDGQAGNVNPEREVRRVKGGYKFRWLVREERDVKPALASSPTPR